MAAVDIITSETFDRWLRELRDPRVYFLRPGIGVTVVLCGGDKHTQSRDITKAHQLAAIWRE